MWIDPMNKISIIIRILFAVTLFQHSSQVELGDDASYAIKVTGSASFQLDSGFTLHIEDILYVPVLTKNLISVGILEDKSHRVILWKRRLFYGPRIQSSVQPFLLESKEDFTKS
jgi:hypothetical protein